MAQVADVRWRAALWSLWRVGPVASVLLGVVAVATAVLNLAFMLVVGRFIGEISRELAGEPSDMMLWLSVVAAAYLGQQILGTVHTLLSAALGRRIDAALQSGVMLTLLRSPGLALLEDSQVRGLANEAADGLGAHRWRPSEVPGALAGLVAGVLSLVLAVGAVVWSAWWLGLLLGGFLVWALREMDRQLARMTVEQFDEEEFRRVDYEYESAVGAAAAKEVRLFGFAPWVLARFRERARAMTGRRLVEMAGTKPAAIVAFIGLIGVVSLGFGWSAAGVAAGTLSVASATVVAQALLAPIRHHMQLMQGLIDIRMSSRPIGALDELGRILPDQGTVEGRNSIRGLKSQLVPIGREVDGRTQLGASPDTQDSATQPIKSAAGTDFSGGLIRFDDVWFRYPGSDVDVLCGVDLEFRPGESAALVGLNGAGKTTLLKLLCRFYDPTEGRITVGGIDIRTLDWSSWQRQVAAIFQDFARFPVSAADNVRFGRLDASRDETKQAAADAGALPFIEWLPAGWETPLSTAVSGGTDLSGGQWQRVALARALLAARGQASVVVLDEPAASLDVRAEAELNERLVTHFGTKTAAERTALLVISHRFSTVRVVDRIHVLGEGRIVEAGTHGQLLAIGGQYAELFRLQAERFAS